MPASVRAPIDWCTGHGCWPTRQNIQGSLDIFINTYPVHRVTDLWRPHCCLHGDTLIATNKGNIKVKDIYERHNNLERFMATSKQGLKLIPSTIIAAYLTKYTRNLIKVTVGSYEIITTLEHEYLLPDYYTYLEAQKLTVGTLGITKIETIEYEEPQAVYDITVYNEFEVQNFMLPSGIFLKNCGGCHIGHQETGSPDTFKNNLKQARIGDFIDCGSYNRTGSDNHFTNG